MQALQVDTQQSCSRKYTKGVNDMIIIAVDDEPIVLGVLAESILEAASGCTVHRFDHTREAYSAIKDGLRPDVAFLDIEMSGMTGLELAKNIRELSCRTKIIFVTAYSQYAMQAYSMHVRGYLLKPVNAQKIREELEELKSVPLQDNSHVRVQTFGNFEIFMDGKPMHFGLSKTKELLAYLVDRRGASVNTAELCDILWEQKPYGASVKSHLRTLLSDLSRSLSAAGADDILLKSRNSFAVDCSKLDCDLYRFLRREPDAVNKYMGEYMKQYTWAEMTLGALEQQK